MPVKSRFTAEEKAKIARDCILGEISINKAGKLYGVDNSTIRDWIRIYKVEGATALIDNRKYRHYSPEQKEAAVKAYLAGEGSLREICRKYNIRAKNMLMDWIKVYNGQKEPKKARGGHPMSTASKKTTLEERILVAKACLAADRNYREVATQYHVSYHQAYTWTKRYEEHGEAGLEDRRGKRTSQQQPRTHEEELKIRIAQLEKELLTTKMERDLLKKLDEVERRDR